MICVVSTSFSYHAPELEVAVWIGVVVTWIVPECQSHPECLLNQRPQMLKRDQLVSIFKMSIFLEFFFHFDTTEFGKRFKYRSSVTSQIVQSFERRKHHILHFQFVNLVGNQWLMD